MKVSLMRNFLKHPLPKLFCNALKQPLLITAIQIDFQIFQRLQAAQNKCKRFCMQLDKISIISVTELLE